MNGNGPCEKNGQQQGAEKENKGKKKMRRNKKVKESNIASDIGPFKAKPEDAFSEQSRYILQHFTVCRL